MESGKVNNAASISNVLKNIDLDSIDRIEFWNVVKKSVKPLATDKLNNSIEKHISTIGSGPVTPKDVEHFTTITSQLMNMIIGNLHE